MARFGARGGTMRLVKIVVAGLIWVAGASGQTPKPKEPPPGPISCTSDVPAETCKHARGVFGTAQKTSAAMYLVEVVIADPKFFREERARLKNKDDGSKKASPTSGGFGRGLSPSIFNILFEPGENGMIGKVVICTDLFGQVNVDLEANETKQMQTPPALVFDKDSVMTWATYVMGYVDGSMWGRAAGEGGK